MAGSVVAEWLKSPVSKTGVAVAHFGRIDRHAQIACSMLRCVGPKRSDRRFGAYGTSPLRCA